MSHGIDPEFVEYLARSCGLSAAVCQRLVLEVLSQYDETPDEFVRRRHQELKALEGFKNDQIYRRLLEEVRERRFAAPVLSERQIRRLIYG
jgi:hypothetical protein